MKVILSWNADLLTTCVYIQYPAHIPNVWYVLHEQRWFTSGESR